MTVVIAVAVKVTVEEAGIVPQQTVIIIMKKRRMMMIQQQVCRVAYLRGVRVGTAY